jgi:hypothetical protein
MTLYPIKTKQNTKVRFCSMLPQFERQCHFSVPRLSPIVLLTSVTLRLV